MRYSRLQETNPGRDYIDSFGGYNHNLRIGENEFYDMQNLTSDDYPVLSPRRPRGVYKSGYNAGIQVMTARDVLCYADGAANLYIDGVKVYTCQTTEPGSMTPMVPKQLVSMGAYIIMMPNKEYYNTVDSTDNGKIEAAYKLPNNETVSYTLCTVNGDDYNIYEIAHDTPPVAPDDKDLWIDTSEEKHVLKQYSADSGIWVQIPTTYIKINAAGIGADFKQYDGVKISGLDTTITGLKDLEGQTSPIWKVYHDANTPANDYIVVVGILDAVATQSAPITVERRMPDMDFVIESGNRLWGCKYGTGEDGKVLNEIYASKLGDFKNWNCFMGISTDSYVASVGSFGNFTGAINHLGYPLFFKEDCLHKVYGSYPANYQMQTTNCKGVQKGAAKSLAIVNSVLYYKARTGVCAYDGSLPVELSANFGGVQYSALNDSLTPDELWDGAAAGAVRDKYYISMRSEKDGKWYLFVYDTHTRMWHKEDNTYVRYFCAFQDEMYFNQAGTDNQKIIQTIYGTTGASETPEGAVKWMAETGILGISSPDYKYISKINVRMSLDFGTVVRFYAQYDSTGEWEHLHTMTGTTLRSFSVALRPKRCDHLRLRIEGVGKAKIFSISKTVEQGSDER